MRIEYSEHAVKTLMKMDRGTQIAFLEHVEKIAGTGPRRHLKYGQPYNVENVGQGRIVFQIEGDTLYITRCFDTHKQYMKWIKSLE